MRSSGPWKGLLSSRTACPCTLHLIRGTYHGTSSRAELAEASFDRRRQCARSCSGYPVGLRQTKWHAFLRAGKLENVTDEDCEFLTATACAWSSTCAPRFVEVEAARDRVCTENDIAHIHRAWLGDRRPAKITMLEKKCKDNAFNAEGFYLDAREYAGAAHGLPHDCPGSEGCASSSTATPARTARASSPCCFSCSWA